MASPLRVNPFLRPAPGFSPGGQRRRLLDQLRHLSQWSRRALLVLGPAGTGKTMLFQQLGREMGDGVLLTQLDGRALNAELDVLIVLAEALGVDVPDSFSAELLKPLVEAALEEHEDAEHPLVVLVDDADQLDSVAMRLLLELCGAYRFRLLLFGQLGLPEQVRSATRDLDVAPYETSLLAFSPVDSRAYLEWRCEQAGVRGGLPFSEEQVADLYRRSNGVPGELNRLAGQLLERIYDEDQSAARLGFPATHLYLVAGLAAVLALSFLLLDRVPLTEEVVTENLPIASTPEPAAEAADPAIGVIDRTDASDLAEQSDVADRSERGEAVSPPLVGEVAPPALVEGGAQTDDAVAEAATTGQPFAAAQPIALPEPAAPEPAPSVSAEPRSAAPELAAPEPAATQTTAPATAQPETREPAVAERVAPEPATPEPATPEPVAPQTDPRPVVAVEGTQDDPAAAEDAAAAIAGQRASTPPPVAREPAAAPAQRRDQPMTMAAATDSVISQVPGLKDGTWLLAQDQGAWTLQLVTLSDRDGLLRYLKRQAEPEQFAVYAREVGGRLLYVVTFGRYQSRVDAEAASRRLPAEVGKIKPWVRPFAEVQNSVTAGR
ncbi:MAG: AAA family ATPase [Pseudomonadota bacterium]